MAQDTRMQRARENRPQQQQQQRPAEMQARASRAVAPPVDIYEHADAFVLVADMPGVAREDLDIQCDRHALTVEGTRKIGDDTVTYRRSFNLPDTVDTAGITARMENGVLHLTLPLSKQAKPRRIEVRGS